jgi:O-antigen ligase
VTNAVLHTRGFQFFALVLMIAFAAASVFFQQPLLVFVPLVLASGAWLITRTEILFYVLIASIPWSIEYITPTFATDLPDEPLMLLTSFSGLMLLFIKRKSLGKQKAISFLLVLLLLQLVWSAFSAGASTDRIVSFKFVLAKSWYLAAFIVAPFILFEDPKVIRKTAIVLAISMLLFTAFTMKKHAAEGFTFSGINPSLNPFFRNHVNYSALLVCIFPLLLAFYAFTKKVSKKWMVLLIVFLLAAIYLSYARGAWLAVFISLGGWWLLKKRMLLAGYIVTILLVFGSLAWLIHNNNYLRFSHDYRTTVFHEDFREHLVATYQLKDVSTAERFYRWIAGVRMVKENPATGFGPNTFPDHYKFYTVPAFKTWVSSNDDRSSVHNYFLTMTIEQGFVGLLLLIVLLGYAFYVAEKIYHRASDPVVKVTARTCAMLLCMLCTVNFLSDLVETDKVGSIFYLTLAVLIVLDQHLLNLTAKAEWRQGTQGSFPRE